MFKICISLRMFSISSRVYWPFVHLLFMKCLFKYFAPIFIALFLFLLLICSSVFYIFDVNYLPDTFNIFIYNISVSLGLAFTFSQSFYFGKIQFMNCFLLRFMLLVSYIIIFPFTEFAKFSYVSF